MSTSSWLNTTSSPLARRAAQLYADAREARVVDADDLVVGGAEEIAITGDAALVARRVDRADDQREQRAGHRTRARGPAGRSDDADPRELALARLNHDGAAGGDREPLVGDDVAVDP